MSVSSERPRPVVLCILDGWGAREDGPDNAIALAKTPNWHRFLATSPHALLDASEHEVGLPAGQMGNSEVGHMNIGGGRVVLQDLPRIDRAIEEGALAANPALAAFIARLKASKGRCHLMGLLSPGGVHSHQAHLAALANILTGAGVEVAVHAFLDGRDTPPSSARGYLEHFLRGIAPAKGAARIATISGRYYAMDRDKRWERVALAWRALVEGQGERAADALSGLDGAYARGESDEFVKPTVIAGYAGMADGDGVLMGNFRADRAREILSSLLDLDFAGFERPRRPNFAAALGMAQYSERLNQFLATLFPPQDLSHTLGEVVAQAGLKQLRIAETEKYAHVTFFFNGGEEGEFPGESRILIPSPKVATYDLKPEMSAYEVTDRLVEAIASGAFDLIVVNYANTDMVGHTGDLSAAIKAVEAVDRCLGRVAEATLRAGGAMIVTSDHGNAEMMRDDSTGQAHTAHTLNRVPVVLVHGPKTARRLNDGRLADIAPTVLALIGLAQPAAMTGRSLIAASGENRASVPTRRARSALVLLLAAAAWGGLAYPSAAQDERSLEQVEQDLAKAKKAAKSAEERAGAARAELDDLRRRLVAAAASAQQSEQEIASMTEALVRLAQEEREKSADLALRRRQTALTLAALERLALRPPVALIAAPGTPLETVRGSLLLKSAVPALAQRSAALRSELEELARVRGEIAASRAALDKASGERGTSVAEIASLIDAKSALLAEAQAESGKAAERAKALAAEAKDMRELISRLAAEPAPRPAPQSPIEEEMLALPHRFGTTPPPPAEVAALGPQAVPLIERPTLLRPFPEAPGGLLMPARGRVVRLFNPALSSNPLSKGVVIETLPEAQVVAPFDGHVVFQGPFRGYGAILIIEHAGGYHTLLSGLGRIDAAVGQWLLAGEPVGVMGSEDRPELYVELRRASQPIDPLPWLQIGGDKVKG